MTYRWAALFLALGLNAAANLMMRIGAKRFRSPLTEQGVRSAWTLFTENWILILGLFCFATNVLFYTYALGKIPISKAYPIMVGGGFAIIAVIAWRYLGETLSVAQWVGVAAILAGIVLLTRDMSSLANG